MSATRNSRTTLWLTSCAVILVLGIGVRAAGAQDVPTPGCPPSGQDARECVVAVDLSQGMVGTGAFTPNSSVRFEIFDSPGGSLLFGPVTKRTDGTGIAGVSFNVIAAGNHVVVTDLATSTVKTLTVAPLRINAVDISADTISGTAGPGDQVRVSALGVEHAVLTVEADETGQWVADFTDFPPEGFDVTAATVVSADVTDPDGDQTHAGPSPGCPASHPGQTCRIEATMGGGIAAFGFTPRSQISFELYESSAPGAPLIYGPETVTTDRTGHQSRNAGAFDGIDLAPGHYVVVTDLATSTVKSLEVTTLSIDSLDRDSGTVSGSARPGDEVFLFSTCTFPLGTDVADDQGAWSVSVSGSGCFDATDQNFTARVYDGDLDAILAQPEPGCPRVGNTWACITTASIEFDSIGVLGFSPESDVTFNVFDPGGQQVLGPVSKTTDSEGNAFIDFGLDPGPNIVPGSTVVATDIATGTVKTNVVLDVSIDLVDPNTDVVEGRAPAGVTVSIEAETAPRNMEVTADSSGIWRADFASVGHDIGPEDWYLATALDEDGDFTVDQLGSPIPGCVDDADTTCGSAAPDKLRENDGEVFAGLEDDVVLVNVGGSTDDVYVDPGKGDDGTVISPDRRHLRATVHVDGSPGGDTTIVPAHADELRLEIFGGDGNDVVKTRDFGGGGSSSGGYKLGGGAGNDRLAGGDGRDRLDGGKGRDVLNGGKGFDVCIGTRGVDTFRSCERIVERRHL